MFWGPPCLKLDPWCRHNNVNQFPDDIGLGQIRTFRLCSRKFTGSHEGNKMDVIGSFDHSFIIESRRERLHASYILGQYPMQQNRCPILSWCWSNFLLLMLVVVYERKLVLCKAIELIGPESNLSSILFISSLIYQIACLYLSLLEYSKPNHSNNCILIFHENY